MASRYLARHALSLDYSALSPATQTALRDFVLDSFAVGVAGCGSPYAAAVRAFATRETAVREASIWGFGDRIGRREAAFCNAFLAHCQEFDCVHEAAVLHPFTVVVPVMAAEAQARSILAERRINGADYLAAVCAGVDIAAGLGVSATSPIRFFRPAVYGLFGATAALCRARGLSETTSAHAFGYALAFASGTMQAHSEGTPALAIQVAHAARCAFDAVDLASAGLPGPLGSIDGPHGLLALFEASHDIERLISGFSGPARADAVSWKPYPTGRAAHGGLELMRRAHGSGVAAEAIASITFEAPPLIHHLVGRAAVEPLEINFARLCLPFLAAQMLRFGRLDLSSLNSAALADPVTLALSRKINVDVSAVTDPAAFVPQRVTIHLHDGRVVVDAIDWLPGSPQQPLSTNQQIAKVHGCFLAAGLDFSHDEADAFAQSATVVASQSDCAGLIDQLSCAMSGRAQ